MAPPSPSSPPTPPTLTPPPPQDGSSTSTPTPTPAPSPVPPPVPVETHPNRGAFKLSISNRSVSGADRDRNHLSPDDAYKTEKRRNASRKRRQRQVWKKLLWIKQHGYPDNYTDTDTFLDHLQRNPRLRPYDFWPLVADSTVIVQHVCSVAIFVSVYAGIYQGRLLPTTVFTCGTIATLAGWIVWDHWTGREEKERLAAAIKTRPAVVELVDDGASTSSGGSAQVPVVTGHVNGDANGQPNGKPAATGIGLLLSTSNLGAKNKEVKASNHGQSLSRSSLQSISPIDSLNETAYEPFPALEASRLGSSSLPPTLRPNISPRTQARLKTVKSALLIYFALLGLSPILKSLTKSTSSDSIWALATSSYTPQFPSSLSTNAGLMASTVLASRLPSTHAVFSLTLFSIQVFGLFPVFRRHLRHVSFPLHVLLTSALIVLATSGLGLILSQSYTHTYGDCNYCLLWIWHVILRSMIGTLVFGSSTVFVMGACSWWLIGLQRYKNVVIGPWDRAKPTPQNDHLNAAAPGELSPPRSQAQDGTAARPVANGEHAADELNKQGGAGGGEDMPGALWKNKKAQEEKHRALEWLVDRDFSLALFGDVVLLGKQQRGQE
ncbi:hypothetical protein DV736_g4678, partial [Chaetothyriales sp. CBS 134916]